MARRRDRLISKHAKIEKSLVWAVVGLLVIALLGLAVWHHVFVRIPPGQVGVLYRFLSGGTVTSYTLPEGLAAKLPWDSVYPYDVRVQRLPFTMTVLTNEGLPVEIAGAVLYHVKPDKAGLLHQTIGPQYREWIVEPISLSSIRGVVTEIYSQQLYSIYLYELRAQVLTRMKRDKVSDLISFDDLVITDVELPTTVTHAIFEKLVVEQVAASYAYRIVGARRHAEMMRIEGVGVQTYLNIVGPAVNKTLLTWRGIERTLDMAASTNPKTIVIRNGQEALPLVLTGDAADTMLPFDNDPLTSDVDPALQLPELQIGMDGPAIWPPTSNGGN